MRYRLLPNPALTLFLTALWLLLNNRVSVGHLLLGLFLGWAIALLVQGFVLDLPKVRRPLRLCLFCLKVLVDIVVANLQVAKLVLGPVKKLQPAFVEVPMEIEHPFVLAVLTSIISLTPGTVSASLRADHRVLLVHALDAPDADALVAELKTRYESPLLEMFECSPT
jgi:multicomponent K+:H+ antiporter subunit E